MGHFAGNHHCPYTNLSIDPFSSCFRETGKNPRQPQRQHTRSASKTAAATEAEEHPHALPVAAALKSSVDEIWQEDDREVLIRSERGAKNNNNNNNNGASSGGPGSGKKEKNKRVNSRKKTDEKAKNSRKLHHVFFSATHFAHLHLVGHAESFWQKRTIYNRDG